MVWQKKIEQILESIREKESLVVALSGGVDSSVTAALAYKALGQKSLAVTINSPLACSSDLENATKAASDIGINHLMLRLDELEIPEFSLNLPNRCYLCKKFRFTKLSELATERGFKEVADGTNLSDFKEFRPGLKAAKELGIYSPLLEAGLSKKETSKIAELLRLPVAGESHNSCLATRVPYGEELTQPKLKRIDDAEKYIKSIVPVKLLRVRDHGEMARLELGRGEQRFFLNQQVSHEITQRLKELGYKFITLDLEGYRFGSFDEK